MRILFLLLVLTLTTGSMANAAIYVISPDGSGDFLTIGECVAHAGSGEIIELTDGMFTGPGNVDINVNGKDLIIRSQSGSAADCRINCEGQPGSTTRAFIIENSATLTLENVGIENGYCTQDWGAGILMRTQAVAVCTGVAFRGNYASWGGAVAVVNGATFAQFNECRFLENISESGGSAIFTNCTEVWLSDCRLIENTTSGSGGALYCEGNSEFDTDGCLFSRNLAAYHGAAIYHMGSGDCDLVNSTFCGNSCAGGSALFFGSNCALDARNTLIVYTTEGVGVDCYTSNFDFENCNIFGNAGGDWLSPYNSELGIDCNINADPQFCSPIPDDHQDWTLQSDSPCTSINSPCGQIGAFGSNCGTNDDQQMSWGAIKQRFKE